MQNNNIMKIDFKQIIKDSGENISQRKLAKEMTEQGLFKTLASAYSMMQYHQTGKAKSCDYQLLKYLMNRFNKKASDILKW